MITRLLRSGLSRVLKSTREPRPLGMDVCLSGLASRGFSPAVVLDVGAAQGRWSQLALRTWPNAHYFLIEPVEEQVALLRRNLGARTALTVVQTALASSPSRRPIGVDLAFLDGSSLVYESGSPRLVSVTTLDILVATGQVRQPQFLKIDVQGFELEVLKGGRELLRSCDLVLVEVEFHRFAPAMPLAHEVLVWMHEAGFRLYEIADVLRRPSDGAMGQCDLLFCQEGHALLRNTSW